MFEHIQQTAPLLEVLNEKLPPGRLPPSLNMTDSNLNTGGICCRQSSGGHFTGGQFSGQLPGGIM